MDVDLPAVFGIGVLTLATPCVLPLLPIYLGMLLGSSVSALADQGGRGRARLVTATLAFALGFSAVFTLLGLGASTLGSFLQDYRTEMLLVGAAVIALFGLKFLGLLKVPFLERELRLPELKTGSRLLDAALFGVVFALGWTPCVGPILGSVLTYTASRAADPLTGALYLATYSAGVATPLVVLSVLADRLVPHLSKLNSRIPLFERVTGVALVVLGLGLAVSASGLFFDEDASEPALAHDGDAEGPIEPPLGEPTDLPRLIEFYEEDCPACERTKARVEGLRQDCAGRRVEILTINASDDRNRHLARDYRVSMVPTFVLVDERGQEQGRIIGAPELEDLRLAAASLLSEICAGVAAGDVEGESQVGGGCPGAEAAAEEPLGLTLEPAPVCEG